MWLDRWCVLRAVSVVCSVKDVFSVHDVVEVLVRRFGVVVPDLVVVGGRFHSVEVFRILRDLVVYGELRGLIYFSHWSGMFVKRGRVDP